MTAASFAETDRLYSGTERRPVPALAFAYFFVFAGLLVALGAIAFFGNAEDGSPTAWIDIAPRPQPHANNLAHARKLASAPARPAAAAAAPVTMPPATAAAPNNALAPAAPIAAAIAKPVVAGRNLVADPALVEESPQGPLPRIAPDGRTPMSAYAPAVAPFKGPRIAIVITGLGISAKATEAAIQQLPPAVTLAFAPYEGDVQRWVTEARRAGHEVLLEVPMEPYDFPDSDPGPHTLRAAVGEESNTERLVWSLTRFTGYAGITNLLGERLLSDPDSLEPVMTYVARRGLLFFDCGPQSHSVAPDIARRIDAPYVQSASNLDTIQTDMEIDARLSQLEQLARTNGTASGTGFVYPVTLDRVANWAKGLQGRGVALVPASDIVAASK